MKAVAFLRAAGAELVSLLVEDWVTFVGGVVALLVMYLLGHDVHSLRAAAGFVAFGLVWLALALSFVRAVRDRRPLDSRRAK
jgi:urea transporter